ncbi:hypothetical protein PT974_00368 [Cladobotryum mycophilum]|uniref:WW domain-containing protein n=1 Tax=Cladobotryum mycophilum TaxID=491253 RepID=A0ABR0T190_9HYPO
MGGSTTPGAEGPTFAPPPLPAGWIAQWDGSSKKYYYVQLATGVSQWEVPTDPVSTGTPTPGAEHPYGTPPPQVITHPDGSQTIKHADGTMEPIMPEGARGVEGATGDRGLGTMAMNALLGGKSSGHGSSGGSNPLGSLAGQFLGGGGGGGSHSSGGSSGGKNSISGKLVGQLASNLFSPSNSKPQQSQNYHGGQSSGASHSAQGGLAGAVMGGVASMFGGKQQGSQGNSFGYSNTGTSGSYSGQAPTYNPLQEQAQATELPHQYHTQAHIRAPPTTHTPRLLRHRHRHSHSHRTINPMASLMAVANPIAASPTRIAQPPAGNTAHHMKHSMEDNTAPVDINSISNSNSKATVLLHSQRMVLPKPAGISNSRATGLLELLHKEVNISKVTVHLPQAAISSILHREDTNNIPLLRDNISSTLLLADSQTNTNPQAVAIILHTALPAAISNMGSSLSRQIPRLCLMEATRARAMGIATNTKGIFG